MWYLTTAVPVASGPLALPSHLYKTFRFVNFLIKSREQQNDFLIGKRKICFDKAIDKIRRVNKLQVSHQFYVDDIRSFCIMRCFLWKRKFVSSNVKLAVCLFDCLDIYICFSNVVW